MEEKQRHETQRKEKHGIVSFFWQNTDCHF